MIKGEPIIEIKEGEKIPKKLHRERLFFFDSIQPNKAGKSNKAY